MKRLLCVMLVIAMLTAYAVPVYAVEDATVTFKQVDNSKVSATLSDREIAEMPEEEAPYADTDVVRVSIVLEKSGTIEAGFSTMDIANNAAAMSYRSKIESDQTSVVAKIENVLKQDLDVVWNLTLAANLISANVEYGQIETIEQVSGVKSVIIETRYEPDVVSTGAADPNMATSGKQIGSSAVWAAGYTGAGTTIAVIDTGADVDHEAFDSAAYDYSISLLEGEYDQMDADDIAGVLSELNAYNRSGVTAEDLYVNSKIPYGFNYVDVDLDITHVNDAMGEHGSHVAGISTANAYVNNGDGTFSPALDTTYVQGVAPDAQLMVMKVFGKDGGAYDSDYMAAIEDAIILGADAVNLSLGSGNPGMSRTDEGSNELGYYQDLLDSLEKSGVVVAISAGNSGYWAESAENGMPYLYQDDVSFQTNGSPGSFTNAFTVASVDNDGFTAAYFNVGDTMVFYNETTGYGNALMTTLGGTQEYVLVDSIGELADFEAIGTDVLTGKIVMCYRGTTSFYEKANNAVSMGAVGVIVVNNTEGVINMNLQGYNYTAPVVSITQAAGELFKTAGTESTTESGITYWTGSMDVSASLTTGQNNSDYYTMSSFSSWGVPGSLELKPEITAPGGSIYSVAGAYSDGSTVSFGDHASYEVMSGTSMAAPQVTGMAALVAQYIRETGLDTQTGLDERTLAQSLLMSTAVPVVDGNSGSYYPVIQQGAGLANVGAATTADSYILMGADATASYSDGKVKAELGDDPEKTGVYSFSYTINNLTDEEKAYALSADVFTQGSFSYADFMWLDTWTVALSPAVTWTVNGKTVEASDELEGLDFNGDGMVDSADGQALLDYATGLDVTLSNEDKADLNGDGSITSYDSYQFFVKLNAGAAVVPANGSAEVTVTITLNEAEKEWLADYENGAYIQAYVYAESLTTAEGVEGTSHSIPVLAYYGNWSDPSMFDKGSYAEYAHGLETRPNYLYSSGGYNGLTVAYADDAGSEYWFGGNPMVADDTYMPERNAINGTNGDQIGSIGFTAIRNAADSYFYVYNTTAGEYVGAMNTGAVDSAYYYTNGAAWRNTYYTLNVGYAPAGLAEDTVLEVGIMLIPEYYVDAEGNADLAALGDGATFSMPMVIDNTAPVLDDVTINTEANTLDITTTDNQYIAAVALYDIYGQHLYTYAGSTEQNAGDTVAYALDLTDVNGPSFLLQVYDYAMNTTTYEITTQIGEVTETIEGIEMSASSIVMKKDSTQTLTAVVSPVNAVNRDVTWTSSDESVVSVDENGTLTANAVGTATITATAAADETFTATCAVEVIYINADLNSIVWDEEGSIWFSQFNTNELPNYTKLSPDMLGEDYFVAAAVGADGTLYASSLNTSSGTGSLYTVDPETYEVTYLADCAIGTTGIFYSDLTYAPAMFGTGVLLGTYGPYVVAIDPATGAALGILDQYTEYLVGIATGESSYDEASDTYSDTLYLIQRDGTVYVAEYGGSGGTIGMTDEPGVISSGVSVNNAWYYNSAYYDGDYLYWSAFDVNTQNAVTLYAIDVNNSSTYALGQFADGVWPVSGLYQMTEATAEAATKIDREIMLPEIELTAIEFPVKETKAGGSLNVVSGEAATVQPLSREEVDYEEGQVYVTVTAKDAEGVDVYSNNGLITVEYDATALVLEHVTVNADYSAVKETSGSVTIGYVDMDGVEEIASLRFTSLTEDDTSVTVSHDEYSDQTAVYAEALHVDIDCDHNFAFDSFEYAEDYSWAKAVMYCMTCHTYEKFDAELVVSGMTAPTCTRDGIIYYTATYGEYSDVTYQFIPAVNHDYKGGSCTSCGAADPDSIASGWSGYTVWSLNSTGVLTISPSGQTMENGQCNMRNYWKVGGVLTLPWGAYADQITTVVIEEGVNAIGQMAFYGMDSLQTVVLPASLTEVRNYAFKNCTALTEINLDTVSFIREGAFYGCSALEDITLADDVEIGDWAFSRVPGYGG